MKRARVVEPPTSCWPWHDGKENGEWGPDRSLAIDDQSATDMLTVLGFLAKEHTYLDEIGFEREITALWQCWRSEISLGANT